MTASSARRRRSTVLALVAALVALVAAIVLSIVGVRTLADSTAGRRAGSGDPTIVAQRLPFTWTALVGVVDDDGRLTSVVAMVLDPSGVGGSIVSIAASADVGAGVAAELIPLDAVLAVDGPEAFAREVEVLTGMSFDVVELVDESRLVDLISPLGDLAVNLPTALRDASSEERWDPGEVTMTSAAAARGLTAVDPAVADWYMEPGRAAIWRAVARRVGAGIGTATAIADDLSVPEPGSLDEFLDRLFAAQVEHRALVVEVIDDDQVALRLPEEYAAPHGSDAVQAVVAHDRAEVLMVLASVAPARIGAPLDAPTFRVVSRFDDDQLDELGVNRSDVIRAALDRLLFIGANIVSVVDVADGDVPTATVMELADPATRPAVEEAYGEIFGEIDVHGDDAPIDGIDIVVTIGTGFVDHAGGALDADVASSSPDDSTTTSG